MNILQALKNFYADKETENTLSFISRIFIFSGLDRPAISKVHTIMYSKKYNVNEIIFSEGDIGKAIFFINDGEVEIIRKDSKGREMVLTKLTAGDFFGEMALLEELPRSAAARVSKEGTLYFIYKVRFDSYIQKDPANGLIIYKNLMKILSSRLRRTSEQI